MFAWAASMRSNGSRCAWAQAPASWACCGLIGSGAKVPDAQAEAEFTKWLRGLGIVEPFGAAAERGQQRAGVVPAVLLQPERDVVASRALEPLELLVRDGVKALASEWGLPARTLRRLCAERHVNLSACRRVFKRELARELLRSREPLGQVAQALGFASTQTLARYVRTEFGCTATELRRALPFFGPSRTL